MVLAVFYTKQRKTPPFPACCFIELLFGLIVGSSFEIWLSNRSFLASFLCFYINTSALRCFVFLTTASFFLIFLFISTNTSLYLFDSVNQRIVVLRAFDETF